jgi:hypothetical protein
MDKLPSIERRSFWSLKNLFFLETLVPKFSNFDFQEKLISEYSNGASE